MDEGDIRDLFADLGPFRVRRMFGGLGLFADDLMFALESDGELYIKADAVTKNRFENAGSRAFTYGKSDGRLYRLGYWRLPDSALDDPAEASRWARLGIEAARRAASAKADKINGRQNML